MSLPLALARWTVTRQRELQYRAVDITAVKNWPQCEHDAWNRGGFSGGLRDLEDRCPAGVRAVPGASDPLAVVLLAADCAGPALNLDPSIDPACRRERLRRRDGLRRFWQVP